MDQKKRKLEEASPPTGGAVVAAPAPAFEVTKEDVKKLVEPFTKEQLMDLLEDAALLHADVLEEIRKLADKDPGHRKIFVRGLGWDTTTDTLKTVFSQFGEVEEGAVIMDKGTGKSRGFGFVTFKHMDGAQRSLKEPSKRIDGRMTVCQLASTGALQVNPNQEVSQRKIYVGNVPLDLSADRLLALFAGYGEIEEGPLGFDKYTGRSRGFALIIYKTVDAAKRALLEPIKTIDGIQMYCKLAAENQKQQQGRQGPGGKGDNDLVLGRQQVSTPQSLSNGQNMPYGSMNTGLITTGIPMNQGVNQGLNQGLHSGLSSHQQGLGGLNSSLNPSLNYPLNSSLSSLGQLSNPSMNGSLNSNLNSNQTSLGMGSYGSQLGMSQYGGQPAGLGGQPAYSSMNGVLYGSAANSVASQQAALQVAGGHYGYGSYPNPQLPASSAPRAPSVGNMYMPTNYNL
jgi:heterogeneous nuclear ribonucleoprotein A1/A3